MTTTAEGVETEQQRDLLRTLGCTEMQGYLFSPAKPAVDLRQLFLSRREGGAVVEAEPRALISAGRARRGLPLR